MDLDLATPGLPHVIFGYFPPKHIVFLLVELDFKWIGLVGSITLLAADPV